MTPTFVPSSGRPMRPLDKILLPYYDDAGNYIDSDLPCVFEDRPMPVPLFTPFSDGDHLNTCYGLIVGKNLTSYSTILGIRLFALPNGLTIQGGRNYPIARGDGLNTRLTLTYKHDRYSREDTSTWVDGRTPQEGEVFIGLQDRHAEFDVDTDGILRRTERVDVITANAVYQYVVRCAVRDVEERVLKVTYTA